MELLIQYLINFLILVKNVAVDKLGAHLNGTTLLANLRFKNLILFSSDTTQKIQLRILKN